MSSATFSVQEREALLALARSAILRWLGKDVPEPEVPRRLTMEKRGIFVTLRQDDELRGCIGYVEALETIDEAVRQLAVKAASEDPRFSSVHISEVPTLSIEISVLTPLEICQDTGTIRIGIHGLVIEKGWSRGLLLPEVASEAGWDVETFLRQCSRKAGLSGNAWRDPATRIYTFSSEHFSDVRNDTTAAHTS